MAFTRRRIRFHCVVCSSECDRRAIQCGDCGRWTHIDCVGFCEDVLDEYTSIQFLGYALVALLAKGCELFDIYYCDQIRLCHDDVSIYLHTTGIVPL